ncbi:MAG: hypothetical protein RLZZ450_2575 [Pseudomonadota bacterium]|jgi:hypothetical protein
MRSSTATDAATSDQQPHAATTYCPVAGLTDTAHALTPQDELALPKYRSATVVHATDEAGKPVVRLLYRGNEVEFDEPELFTFAERLVKQSRFTAGSAALWGEGLSWARVRPLLEQLLDAGILARSESVVEPPVPTGPVSSPLPAAPSNTPHTWCACEELSELLGGRAIEQGYLEVIMPVYRLAHPALDAEDRQVGEANVFPGGLRIDVPTEWRVCSYGGSRYLDDFPMNVTALKTMIKEWKPLLAVTLQLRDAYLGGAGVAGPLTVGNLMVLSSLIMALPAYLLAHPEHPLPNGHMHPLFSSLFRIVDGVRLVTYRKLYQSAEGGSALPSDVIRASEIYPFADAEGLFLSASGVCAGSRPMIEEFLRVLVDGERRPNASLAYAPEVATGLTEVDDAFAYGLAALRVYALAFSLWPAVSETCERLSTLCATHASADTGPLQTLALYLQGVRALFEANSVETRAQRAAHARAYGHLYAETTATLDGHETYPTTLSDCLQTTSLRGADNLRNHLTAALAARLGSALVARGVADEIAQVVLEHVAREQAIVRATEDAQAKVNGLLRRVPPSRALTGADVAFNHAMRGASGLPSLSQVLHDSLGFSLVVSANAVTLVSGSAARG